MGEGWMIIHKYLIFSIYGSSTKPLHSTSQYSRLTINFMFVAEQYYI
jgi:hypothetical protein